jgi:predicted nucleic acid-binding protein
VRRKAVFDAMVFLQAVANPAGPSGACFASVRSGDLTLVTSPETVEELRGLLARPNIRKKFPSLTDERAADLIAEVERVSDPIAKARGLEEQSDKPLAPVHGGYLGSSLLPGPG